MTTRPWHFRRLTDEPGIIILTTNRINSIDIAVKSRVHLAIQYKDLTPPQRIAIYKNNIMSIPESEIEDRDALLEDLERQRTGVTRKNNKSDGRQIRNIVIMARALAKKQGKKLNIDHLAIVDESTSEFLASMKERNDKIRALNEAAD